MFKTQAPLEDIFVPPKVVELKGKEKKRKGTLTTKPSFSLK